MQKLTQTMTARLTIEEFNLLKTRAAEMGVTTSAYLRQLIVSSPPVTEHESFEQVLMGEFLALRAISINLLFKIATHSATNEETIAAFIKQADHDKSTWAAARLEAQGVTNEKAER